MATLLSDEITEKIENKIKKMEIGEKLPSERKMAEEFGVSRNMLRESLRVLSDKGIIEILPGKGAYVANKQKDRLADHLEQIIFENTNSLMDLVEVRRVVEMEVCLKAVKVATADDILTLETIYRKMEETRGNVKSFNEADMEFHLQIAKASHNSIYPLLLSALYNISEKKIFGITELYPTRVDSAQREHRALIDAIRNHDRKMVKSVAIKHFNIKDILLSQSILKA